MNCPREHELLDALGRGYVGAELDEHVASCADCTELRVVAGALLDDRTHAVDEAPIPAAGTVLFRMRLRHRQEAQRVARRSLMVGQAVTLIVAVAVVVSLFGTDIAAGVREAFGSIHLSLSTRALFALAAGVLLVPIAGIAGWVVGRGK